MAGFISNSSSTATAGFAVSGAFSASSTSVFNDTAIFNGNVGIGNASPKELLHVVAGTDASDISATDLLVTRAGPSNLSVRDSTNGVETFIFSSSVGGIMGTVTDDPLDIKTNNATAIFIDASQNVGIASTTITGDFAVGDGVTQASSTFAGPVIVSDPTHVGTSTIFVSSDTALFGGSFILENPDGATCSEVSLDDAGTALVAVVVTCPVISIEP